MKHVGVLPFVVVAAVIAACSSDDASSPTVTTAAIAADPFSGGETTVFDTTSGAYANQAKNLTDATASSFSFGHSVFSRSWVTAPATTDGMDGLGPRFNQRSCSACHSKDGRSPPYDSNGAQLGMLFRLSVPGTDAHGGPNGDPIYGTQLRTNALLKVPDDGIPHVTFVEQPGTYGDGTAFSLRMPTNGIDTWGDGPPAAGLMISARVAPYTIGLGLLQAIPEADILANIKTGDPDGIVGHANHVWAESTASMMLGRFGWKANVATALDQSAGAFQGDIGITSRPHPDENCTPTMTLCNAQPKGGTPELTDDKLVAVDVYMRTLAVPARRTVDDPTVVRGAALFASFRCNGCHATEFKTAATVDIAELANQKIHPYTDLLLHDMGDGLSDGRPDFEAGPKEWRTPPLWGIGLLNTVNGHEFLIHDGRARGLEEAILWHGGEAQASRERFRNASADERNALVTFLHSL